MKVKTYKLKANPLHFKKTELQIGPEGITKNGTLDRWEDITHMVCWIVNLNGTINHMIGYRDANGKRKDCSMSASMMAKKEKKKLHREIYTHIHEGFAQFILKPQGEKMKGEIESGKTISIGSASVSTEGVQIKKGQIVIPFDQLEVSYPEGKGCFTLGSKVNSKEYASFPFEHRPDNCQLLALIEILVPSQATYYFPNS